MRKNQIKAIAPMLLASLVMAGCNSDSKTQAMFDGVELAKSYKPQGEHNPLATQRFGADPYAMEYNGRVYVYMTNDVLEYDTAGVAKNNSFATINKIFCISSDDLVNWTDHGAMPIAGPDGAAKWAHFSWAPTACHKTIDGKEKFFLYFANSGNGIGVVTSDTPYGPWTDPIGKPIVSRETPTCASVTWLFDPAVLVDDNGDGYLFVGGGVPFIPGKGPQFADPGTARVVKLDASLTGLDGDPVAINPPYLFEDAGANKIGDTYYYSYCTNFNSPEIGNGRIAYMTSKNPMGPYTFQGTFFNNPGDFFGIGGNNHHAVCKLGDEYFLFYHAQILRERMGITADGYRSTNVDKVTITEDGKIQQVTGTYTGVEQTKAFNPFNYTEAETMARMGGIETRYLDGTTNLCVTGINTGDWLELEGVDFAEGASQFTAKVASSSKGAIKICLDKADGECVGYLAVGNTKGQFSDVTAQLSKPVSGKHDLYFIFAGEFEFDGWQFK